MMELFFGIYFLLISITILGGITMILEKKEEKRVLAMKRKQMLLQQKVIYCDFENASLCRRHA